MEIRRAVLEDADTLLTLVKALAAYERAPSDVVATRADFERGIARNEMDALIAEEEGRAIGFALFFPTWSTWRGKPGIHLEDLFVVPEARGRGVGKALLVAVADVARSRGCARLEWQVLDWNEPALAFYRSLGARELREWTLMRVDDESLVRLAAWHREDDRLG